MKTLLLTRSHVTSLLDPIPLMSELRSAFIAYSQKQTWPAHKVRGELPAPGNAHVLVPGLVSGIPAYSVKVNAKYPKENPAIRGILHLHDLQTGKLLALMDATFITAARTALTGALALDLLARQDARSLAIIGAGIQGEFHLRYTARLRPLDTVHLYDIVPGHAQALVKRLSKELSISFTVHDSVQSALQAAEMIVTATWAEKAFVFMPMLKTGTVIITVGPDEPGKCEVDASVITKACFVCDDRELALKIGAIGGAGLGADAIHAELGEVLAGIKSGRTSSEQTMIFGSVGLPFQDLVAAWHVYQRAQRECVGEALDFLS